MQLVLERFGFVFVEIGDDVVDVQVDDGLATFGGEEEGTVFLVVHEEVLGQDCRAERVLKNVEGGLEVRDRDGVGIGEFDPNLVPEKDVPGGGAWPHSTKGGEEPAGDKYLRR